MELVRGGAVRTDEDSGGLSLLERNCSFRLGARGYETSFFLATPSRVELLLLRAGQVMNQMP